MKKTNRVLQCFIAIALICACALFTLTACNPNEQKSTPNNENNDTSQTQQPSDSDDNNTTQTPSSGSEDNDTPSTPSQTPSDDDKQENPSDTPTTEKSEVEYKVMFEEKLPTAIETHFNNQLANKDWKKVSNVEVKAYNNVDGSVYFTCKQYNGDVNSFIVAKLPQLAGSSSYKELNEKLSECIITTNVITGVTIQEQSLANEIAEFALEQQEVIDYLAENGIDKNELKVLNATLFETAGGGYRKTVLLLLSKNNVFSVTLVVSTGICSTQKEYLTKFGYLERVEIGEAIPFAELKVAEDEA